ncbi:MAG TPA: hypothetical protein VF944_10825 [Candidatus Bathyarchaeia archaeon]
MTNDPVVHMIEQLIKTRDAQITALENIENILKGMDLLRGETRFAGLNQERILQLLKEKP